MRVVVTGAAGFVGSHLCAALAAQGHQVVGLDRPAPADAEREANLAAWSGLPGTSAAEADLRADDLRSVLAGADAVVHQAAATGLGGGWDGLDRYVADNVTATGRLVDAALAVRVGHLVHASTSSVYGAVATTDEDGPTAPVSAYGVTKLAAEHVVAARAGQARLPTTILRYFSVYGPRQRPDMAYRTFAERLLRGEPVVVHGDGRQTRSNTYVDDCVAATLAALARPPAGVRTCNVGGGEEIALLDALALIAEAAGVEARVEHRPARPGDQRRTVADIGRARRELGWEPVVPAAEGIRRQVEWVRCRA